jgi:LPPG:FO 2-phospho-L-lactate transferase
MIVALAGGVGGAKMAQGLALALDPAEFSVVVNTADDFDHYGLRICPDLDTVLYTLAGLADPVQGWGIAGDTSATLRAIARYGRDPWFRLGDQDFATHILRSERLREGATLTEVTAELAASLGVVTAILPMCDEPVATVIETPAGRLAFQDYFVARRQVDDVLAVEFAGVAAARPTAAVTSALAAAELIVLCPSNPIVSVGPILSVPGLRSAIERGGVPVVAVSPIVGGRALKGPADKMLATLGHEVSAAGVAALYAGLVDGLVIDEADRGLDERIASLGMAVLVTGTVMGDAADRRRLAADVLAFGRSLAGVAGVGQ